MQKNKVLLVGISVAVIGLIVLVQSQQMNKDSDNKHGAAQSSAAATAMDIDLSSLNGPYEVQFATNGDPNSDVTATAEVDSRGNVRTAITERGTTSTFLYVDGSTYIQLPGEDEEWLQFNNADSDSGPTFGSDDVSVGYSAEDIAMLANVQKTQDADCSLGRCRSYTADNTRTNESVRILIDTGTNRISDIELTAPNGRQTTITYRYNTAVATVEAPPSFREFNASGTGVSQP